MSKMQIPKKLRIEDFPAEFRELVGKLSSLFTPFMDDTYNVLNGSVDFSNLNRQVATIDVVIGSNGLITNPPQIRMELKSRLQGINVISAINLINPGVYPTSSPFVSWNTNVNILNIVNVTGLQAGSQYRLTLELIG